MLFRRFGVSSKTQRITLSLIALGLALTIALLQGGSPQRQSGVEPEASEASGELAPARSRTEAVAHAVAWLQAQEGGRHKGHAIARHVAKSEAELRARIAKDGVSAASAFYDLETAAVAIVRTINHAPNKDRMSRWLGDDKSRRRLALRRTFERPIGRVVSRDGQSRDGASAVAVLTKQREGDRVGYKLLTAYVEP